jgi:hypothetical protein
VEEDWRVRVSGLSLLADGLPPRGQGRPVTHDQGDWRAIRTIVQQLDWA